jgi:peptidoglycan hydrolase-like protein with peptidoglycan-binding domain
MNHIEARPIIIDALRKVLGREPDLAEVYVVQALAGFDGGYGHYASPPHGPEGPTANNMGAVQHVGDFKKYLIWRGVTNHDRNSAEVKALLSIPGPPSPKPTEWFYGSDYQAPSDGGKGWFWAPYKIYPTKLDGAIHVASLMNKMGALKVAKETKNWISVARQLREKKYFMGYGGDPEYWIRAYAKNLADKGAKMAAMFHESCPLSMAGEIGGAGPLSGSSSEGLALDLPTLRFKSKSHAVKLWQRIIGVKDDGDFGTATERATKDWQAARGLTPDGVVGVKSWEKAP